jgi:hypothetical protein
VICGFLLASRRNAEGGWVASVSAIGIVLDMIFLRSVD